MQCQYCKKRAATIHLTEIDNGQRVEAHFCESCARKQGLAVKNQIPLNELLSTLLAAQSDPLAEPAAFADSSVDDITCPCCGMTLKRFLKESLLGCANDYKAFDESLRLIIEKSHRGNMTHCGKVPSTVPSDTKKQAEQINLRSQLEAAVRNEDYETAAKLRDRMEKLQ